MMTKISSDSQSLSWQGPSAVHLPRKLWHVSAGLVALLSYFAFPQVGQRGFAWIAAALGLVSLSLEWARLHWSGLNRLYLRAFRPLLRRQEMNHMSGVPAFAFGCSLTLFLFPEKLAVLSVIFLVFADPVASYVGIKHGTQKILPGKTLEGCSSAFALCFFLSLVYCLLYEAPHLNLFLFSLGAGLVGAASESLSFWVNDNFSIPVVSGLGLSALNAFFIVFPAA